MREAAQEVLSRSHYEDLAPTLIDRGWAFLLDMLGRIIDLLGQTGQGGIIGSVLLVAAIVVLAVAALRWLSRVRRAAVASEIEVGVAGRSPHDWTAAAQDHEQAGRLRDALRCRHRALVAELALAGFVDEVPGRTAAEYSAAVGDAVPAAAEQFALATRMFERAWYADHRVTHDDLARFDEAATAVRSAAGLRRPARAGS